MATTAVAQKPRTMIPEKAAEKIVYQLIKKNERLAGREDSTPEYKPLIIMKNTSTISVDGVLTNIRYIAGYKSIFVHEQEPENRPIPENIVSNPKNSIHIVDGRIEVSPKDSAKIKFLDLCSQNADSPHRYDQVVPLFRRVNSDAGIGNIKAKQDLMLEAVRLCDTADEAQIIYHAKQLGLNLYDPNTGESRKAEAIKTDYRQAAFDSPAKFIEVFNDMDLKLKYWIEKAIESNTISVTTTPGYATLVATKQDFAPIQSGSDPKAIVESLYQFMNKKAGEEIFKLLRDKYA